MNPAGDFAGGGDGRRDREHVSELSREDRAAIATYIASLPPIKGRPTAEERMITSVG